MDPKDLNNPGGLQAKDKDGAKGKKPGKVAGTDDYGQGGPGGASAAVPGKRSGTEHLPDGKNGESKAKENEGKFGGGAGNQTPPVQPKGKEVPATVKPKKSGPPPKVDAGAVPTKNKAGG